MTRDSLHGYGQHDPTKAKRRNDNNNTNNNNNDNNNDDDNNSTNLIEVPDFQSIDFGFHLSLAKVSDFDSFDFGLNTSIDIDSLNEMVYKPCIPSFDSKFHDNDNNYSNISNQLKEYRGYA